MSFVVHLSRQFQMQKKLIDVFSQGCGDPCNYDDIFMRSYRLLSLDLQLKMNACVCVFLGDDIRIDNAVTEMKDVTR